MENKDIHHPDHYCKGRKYEPKDVIRDWGLNFNLGSAVKYISRGGRKKDIVEDLLKAREYIDSEIEVILNKESLKNVGESISNGTSHIQQKIKETKKSKKTVEDMLFPHCSPDLYQKVMMHQEHTECTCEKKDNFKS